MRGTTKSTAAKMTQVSTRVSRSTKVAKPAGPVYGGSSQPQRVPVLRNAQGR